MIDAAGPEDFAAIAALNVLAYGEFAAQLPPGSWELMQKNLRNIEERARSAGFLVCRRDGAVVGSVAYCPAGKGDPAIFDPDMASMLLLAVHPQHRGAGIARALAEACIARARHAGAGSVALFTSELMLSAQGLYRSLGFHQDIELPRRHGVRYFRFVLALDGREER